MEKSALQLGLEHSTVFRKITNGFRTEWGAKLYANIPLRHRNRRPGRADATP
jgi:hypothetical protein